MNEFSAKKAVCSPEFVRPGFDQAIKIACMSWCTANREITPILFKYKGEDEMIYTVRDGDGVWQIMLQIQAIKANGQRSGCVCSWVE